MISTLPKDGVLNHGPSGHVRTPRTDGLTNTLAVDKCRSSRGCWWDLEFSGSEHGACNVAPSAFDC